MKNVIALFALLLTGQAFANVQVYDCHLQTLQTSSSEEFNFTLIVNGQIVEAILDDEFLDGKIENLATAGNILTLKLDEKNFIEIYFKNGEIAKKEGNSGKILLGTLDVTGEELWEDTLVQCSSTDLSKIN